VSVYNVVSVMTMYNFYQNLRVGHGSGTSMEKWEFGVSAVSTWRLSVLYVFYICFAFLYLYCCYEGNDQWVCGDSCLSHDERGEGVSRFG